MPGIVLAPHDEAWADGFAAVRDAVWAAVDGAALRIDHVGSTAVHGLVAKPILDVDVVVADKGALPEAAARLAGIGYRSVGDLGVTGRGAFETPAGSTLPVHHLYLVVDGSKPHLDHVLLRDLLRRDPVARTRYQAVKRHAAREVAGDVEVYTARKAAVIAELLTRAREERGLPPSDYWVPTPAELGEA